MKKNYFFAGLVLLLVSGTMFAQSFTPNVVGTAGAFAGSANGSMSWTIGEVITDTYSSSGNSFTQGFQQPEVNVVTLVAALTEPAFSIFPNPVSSFLNIGFPDVSGNYLLELFNAQGKLLYTEEVSGSLKRFTLPFSTYSNGIYMLRVSCSELRLNNSYQIIKAE
jgi:hypothetical protein